MANISQYYALRDYTMPAIDRRIALLLKRRIGALDGMTGESFKERLAKYKENRNLRQGWLKTTHRHVLEMVAYILNTEPSLLEEGIIDKDEYVNTFSSFFAEGGRQAVVIYYQMMPPPPIDSGRWSAQLAKEPQIMRCCVTDGSTEKLCGKCVVVYRLRSNIDFETKQLLDETYYAYTEVDPATGSALAAVSDLITRLNEPAISLNTQWGELTKSEAGKKIKHNFIGDFKDFCEFLSMTKIDLEGAVKFDVNWDLYNKYLTTPESVMANIKNPEVVLEAEAIVRLWMKSMERAIVESQQLRRETETVGPTAELTYWRRILARFSSIVEHIKSHHSQMYIQLLIQSKSKLIKKWKRLDNHVTTVQILSQDNVRYLYALEKFTQPLYRLDPTKIGDYLPSLMYAIRMIYATSRFFNTRRMVTAVFVKMTNQMILACRAYLTENGTLSVWDDAKCDMISRMKDCINLYQRYHVCYDEMRAKVKECPDEKPFEVSEMYVFGKFNTFKMRINKLIDVLQTTLTYSILHSSTIEGIDVFAQKFTGFFTKIAGQTYDPLNHRKPYFDPDYAEFKKSVAETEIELRLFFFKTISVAPNIGEALRMVGRFQKLNFRRLRIDRKYLELVTMYQEEVETIRDRYNEDRSEPPLPRNIPPVAGRILWIRQLYRRAEDPMNIFKTRQRVITHERMQKCIKIYNALISVFIHYELIYHKAWYDSADIVRLALSSPLLVRHPKTNKYCLNFDPYIYEVIRESEHMSRFGLEVPDFIQIITFCKEKIFSSYETVKKMVEENNVLRRSVPILFLNMIKPAFIKLEIAFQPCLSVVTWASLKIPQVCADIKNVITEVQTFVKELKDMKDARVDEVFESIADTRLIKLASQPQHPTQFSADNMAFRNVMAVEVEIKSSAAEKAVITIINKFMGIITDPSVAQSKYDWMDPEKANKQVGSQTKLTSGPFEPGFGHIDRSSKLNMVHIHNDCMELFAYFNFKLIEALVKSTKASLDMLKKRVSASSVLLRENIEGGEIPLMKTQFVLQIPNIIIIPPIEELQTHFGMVITNVIGTHKGIVMWGQRYSPIPKRRNTLGIEIEDNNSMPPKKTRKVLNSQARKVIESVVEFFEGEANKYRHTETVIPVAKAHERCAEATSVSLSTIRRIRKKKKIDSVEGPSKLRTPNKHRYKRRTKTDFDDTTREIIRRTIHNFIMDQKAVPTLRKLLPILRDKIDFKGSRETLRKVLKEMGFKWKKTRSNRAILIERNDVRHQRIEYLEAIRAYRRAGRRIVYMDESYVLASHVNSSLCCDKSIKVDHKDSSKGQLASVAKGERLIMVHAGGEAGFVPKALVMWRAGLANGNDHDKINSENCGRWIREKLIPNLESNTVLVIGNALYHRVQEEEIPTSGSTKNQMLDWLIRKGISCSEQMYKTQLYRLITMHKPRTTRYVIDELLTGYGHTVLRPPQYHPDFNPLHTIWSQVKNHVGAHNVTYKIADVQRLCEEKFEQMDANTWTPLCEHVKKLEDEYIQREHITDREYDIIIVSLGGAESSSGSETDSATDDDDDDSMSDIEYL